MTDHAVASPLEAVRAELDRGRALPSSWYTDGGHHAWEVRQVLRRGWHFAAHAGEVANVGDQLPVDVAGVPIVLVRGDDGVDGFVNICRHRAHVVVLEPRSRRAMTCGYHGWSYGLDGSLRHAPRSELEPGFDTTACSLARVQVAQWGPMIWVNPDLSAPAFDAWIGSLPELVASNGIDVTAQSARFDDRWDVAANWKVFVDNAIECYHCPVAHPTLSRVIDTDPRVQELAVGGPHWSSHRVPLRPAAGRDSTAVYVFHWVWPTTYVQYVTGGGFDVGSIRILDVGRIEFRHVTFLPTTTTPDDVAARRERMRQDPTVAEDVAICEGVQRAHASGVAEPGRLLPGSEQLVSHFQRVLVDALATA